MNAPANEVIVGYLTHLARLPSSKEGNPRYNLNVTTESGVRYLKTPVNASIGYALGPCYLSKKVEVELDRSGNAITIKEVGA